MTIQTSIKILLITTIIHEIRSSILAYDHGRENATATPYDSMLSNFGLELEEGEGLAGFLLQGIDLHSKADHPELSQGCTPIKRPPRITGRPYISESRQNQIQKLRQQSTNSFVQQIYDSACKLFNNCNENKLKLTSMGSFFVLLSRGNCTFSRKVRTAQQAGYYGAIIYDPNSDYLIAMHASDSEGISILSTFVGNQTATEFTSHYLYDLASNGIDPADQPFLVILSEDANWTEYLLPFSLIVAVCLATMLGFSSVRLYRQWKRNKKLRLTRRKLKKLPKKTFSKDDNYETCAICLDDYEIGDKLRILPCDHAFHAACIDPWLTRSRRNCPLCKRSVLSSDDDEESDEEVLNTASHGNGDSSSSQSDGHSTRRSEILPSEMHARLLADFPEESYPTSSSDEFVDDDDEQPLLMSSDNGQVIHHVSVNINEDLDERQLDASDVTDRHREGLPNVDGELPGHDNLVMADTEIRGDSNLDSQV